METQPTNQPATTGSARAAHTALPWSVSTYSNYHGFAIKSHDGFGCIAERWEDAPSTERKETMLANAELIVASVNRLPALVAAVDKALAAWDDPTTDGRYDITKQFTAMQELRALQQEMK